MHRDGLIIELQLIKNLKYQENKITTEQEITNQAIKTLGR